MSDRNEETLAESVEGNGTGGTTSTSAVMESIDSFIDSLPSTMGEKANVEHRPKYSALTSIAIESLSESTESGAVNVSVINVSDQVDEDCRSDKMAPQSVETDIADLPVDGMSNSHPELSNDQNQTLPINTVGLRETPLDVRVAIGPFAVMCKKHYLELRRVPEDKDAPPMEISDGDKKDLSESLTAEHSPFAFPTSSRDDSNLIADDIPTGARTMVQEASQLANQLVSSHGGADDVQLSRPYISRTLDEVKDATRKWFLTEQNRGVSPPESDNMTDFFSLQFNETSLSTIALWVAGGPKRKCASTTVRYRPIVDTRFRICSVCHMIGHHEVECQNLSPELTMQFSKSITTSDDEHAQQNNLFQKKYDVTIEICDGYLIEQRSREETLDGRFSKSGVATSNDPNIERPTKITNRTFEMDGFTIKEGGSIESLSKPTIMDDALPSPTPDNQLARIRKGCLVTWCVNTDDARSNDFPNANVLAVGTVADLDKDLSRVQVRFIRFLEPKNHGMARKRKYPAIEPFVWVPVKSLHYVDERNRLLLTDNTPTRKKKGRMQKKPIKNKQDKLATKSNKNKRELANPAKSQRLKTGPSKRPRTSKSGMF